MVKFGIRSKSAKIKGWDKLVEAYENNKPVWKNKSKCRADALSVYRNRIAYVSSRISNCDKPLKDISHLMNEPQVL